MTFKAAEGNLKAWLATTAPATWPSDGTMPDKGTTVVTQAELTAATPLTNLLSDGGVTITPTSNTASLALVDSGIIAEQAGTRQRSGEIRHATNFPEEDDAMYALYSYGDKRWLFVSDNGEPAADGDLLKVYEVEIGDDPQTQPAAQDTKRRFHVPLAVQAWDESATFSTT